MHISNIMAHKSQKLTVLAILKQASEPIKLSMLENKVAGISQRTLRRWLSHWAGNGVIEKSGQGKATQYRYHNVESDPTSKLTFLDGLDSDLRLSLINQLRDLWTHNSTAIEGNTLTLGDTHFVLEEGLTISGKPLKDHQEIIGHAKAIELIYKSLSAPLTESFLFDLHKAVLTEHTADIYKPVGHWKVETNGTYAITNEGIQTFIEYALPQHVPQLISQLIDYINTIDIEMLTFEAAPKHYAKIHIGLAHIHPFWDGNGRIARLISNIPLLKAGLPPLVIPQKQRRTYIQTLATYQITIGQLDLSSTLWPNIDQLKNFESFCDSAYSTTKALVEKACTLQEKRSLLS